MSHKCSVFDMLVSLHSLGLIFASLFTYKWHVDSSRDIGIFGICENFNASTINSLLSEYNVSLKHYTRQQAQVSFLRAIYNMSDETNSNVTGSNITLQARSYAQQKQEALENSEPTYTYFSYGATYQKCYQLFWLIVTKPTTIYQVWTKNTECINDKFKSIFEIIKKNLYSTQRWWVSPFHPLHSGSSRRYGRSFVYLAVTLVCIQGPLSFSFAYRS